MILVHEVYEPCIVTDFHGRVEEAPDDEPRDISLLGRDPSECVVPGVKSLFCNPQPSGYTCTGGLK